MFGDNSYLSSFQKMLAFVESNLTLFYLTRVLFLLARGGGGGGGGGG